MSSDWDASTYKCTSAEIRDRVSQEALTLYDHGLRISECGPFLFVAGPEAVVASMDAWVIELFDELNRIQEAEQQAAGNRDPFVASAWSPSADVD